MTAQIIIGIILSLLGACVIVAGLITASAIGRKSGCFDIEAYRNNENEGETNNV